MKHLRILPILLLLIVLHMPARSFGWGATGHQIIVNTALSLVKDSTRQKVMAILNANNCPIDSAAIWMDIVRKKVPQYSYMNNWHFLNMDSGKTYKQVMSDTDVVYNLTRVHNLFEQRLPLPMDATFLYLKVLFHLMGDISQPLHVGYGIDAGGNSITVKDPIDHYEANLHHVWDDIIIEAGKLNQDSITNFCKSMSLDQIQFILSGTPELWMMEARLYLPNAYAFNRNTKEVPYLTWQYLNGNVPIVREQLGRAAIRLADALEKSFGNKK